MIPRELHQLAVAITAAAGEFDVESGALVCYLADDTVRVATCDGAAYTVASYSLEQWEGAEAPGEPISSATTTSRDVAANLFTRP